MSENWKFSELTYERPDVEKAIATMRETTQKIRDAKSGEEELALIMEQEERDRPLTDMIMLARIRHTLNTADEFYNEEYAWIAETMPTIMEQTPEISATITASLIFHAPPCNTAPS